MRKEHKASIILMIAIFVMIVYTGTRTTEVKQDETSYYECQNMYRTKQVNKAESLGCDILHISDEVTRINSGKY